MSGDLAGDSSSTYAVVDKTRKKKKKNGSFPQSSQKPLPHDSAMAMYAVVDKTKKSRATSEKPLAESNDDIPTYDMVTTENMYSNTGIEASVDDSAVYDSTSAPTYSKLDRPMIATTSSQEKTLPKEQLSSASYYQVTDTDRNNKEDPSKKQYKLIFICCLISLLVAIAFIVAAGIALIVALLQISHLRSDVALLNSTLSSTATSMANSSSTNAVISENTLVSNLTMLDNSVQDFMNTISTGFRDLQTRVTINISEVGDRLDDLAMLEQQVLAIESETAANLTALKNVLNIHLQNITSNITTQLSAFRDQIIANVTENNNVTEQNIEDLRALLDDIAEHTIRRTFSSCAVIQQLFPSFSSGYYRVMSSNGSAITVYCDMNRTCGGITGGWMRVALLDMRDTSTQCPSGFIEQTNSTIQVRYCIQDTTTAGCSAIDYQTNGIMYSQVCGMIRGYQVRAPDGFSNRFNSRLNPTVDSNYVDGVSLTHGTSSIVRHIWSFAASLECTCSIDRPSFVGNDFSCDGVPFSECRVGFCGAVLWDGKGCLSNNSPWFYKQLQNSTTDDIEMRVCRDELRSDEDIAIEIVEILVQ